MKSIISWMVAAVLLAAIVIPPEADAFGRRFGYRNNNNFYMQQQRMRQQQQMAAQRAAAQRQAEVRRQQAAQRQRQQAAQRQRQIAQQKIRARQQQIRNQTRQKQQAAIKKRQQIALQNSRKRSTVSRNSTSGSSTIARNQRPLTNNRQSFRQQRLLKDRQNRLRKLRLQRDKDQKKQAKSQQTTNITLASLGRARLPSATVSNSIRNTRTTPKAFKQNWKNNKSNQKNTAALSDARKLSQQQLKRISATSSQLRKLQNKPVVVAKKDTKKLNQAVKRAQKNFRSCQSGQKCACSFHGDTLVLTELGAKPIRDIKAGIDRAWAKSEYTGESGWKLVTNHYSNQYDESVYVSYGSGTIHSNRIHPFFVPNKSQSHHVDAWNNKVSGKWVQAQNLGEGVQTVLLSKNGNRLPINSVSINQLGFTAFNLSVDQFRTYFVSDPNSLDNQWIWVHNDCDQSGKEKRYQGEKPKYHVNDAHVPGKRGFNPRKTKLPKDAEDVYKKAIPSNSDKPSHWYGKNKNGQIYRFSNANDGTVHFSGIASKRGGFKVPKYVRNRMGEN